MLEALELKNVKLNQMEWSVVRQTLLGEGKSKPRRFSAALISEEFENLNNYREIFREVIRQMQHKNFVPDQNGDISMLYYDRKLMYNVEIIKEVV